jgi:DNA-binding NarL/FixJ family response regulator
MSNVCPAISGNVIRLESFERTRNGAGRAFPQVRVLVADHQFLVRAGVRALLEARPEITVVAEADTAERAIGESARIRPDVVLLDLDLPGIECDETTRRILAHAHSEVVLLTSSATDRRILPALHAGARGLLMKDTEGEELAHAVELIAHGQEHVSPSLTRRLMALFEPAATPSLSLVT